MAIYNNSKQTSEGRRLENLVRLGEEKIEFTISESSDYYKVENGKLVPIS